MSSIVTKACKIPHKRSNGQRPIIQFKSDANSNDGVLWYIYFIQTDVQNARILAAMWYLYYNYEDYQLSPLKPRFLVLFEQYLPNTSDPVYSVHQSFIWFLWLNWRKSTFYPATAPNDSKCWPIVTSSIQEPAASNCDVAMTGCSRVVAMDDFLAQWNRKFTTAKRSTENTSCFNFFVYFLLNFVTPVF